MKETIGYFITFKDVNYLPSTRGNQMLFKKIKKSNETQCRTKSQLFLTLLFLIFHSYTFSQNGLFLSGSIDFGSVGRAYSFQKNETVLKRNWLGTEKDDADILYSPELNLRYHFLNRFGASLNLKITDKAAVFHDSRFMNTNDIQGVDYAGNKGKLIADSGNFNPNRNFFSPNISFQYHLINDYNGCGPYISYGIGYNQILGSRRDFTSSYFHESSKELLELQMHYRKRYLSQYVEVGFIGFPGYISGANTSKLKTVTRGAVWNVGFRYTFAGTYMIANYEVSKYGTSQYTDRLTLGAGYFSVVVKVGGSIFGRKINSIHKKRYENEQIEEERIRKEREERVAENHSRDISVKQEIVVKSKVITISVWDHLKYDKDIIRLELNGKSILEDYTLQHSKKIITMTLDSQTNTLVLYAISEGEEKPCTVAVIIYDGFTKQQIILNSNMELSEAINIRLTE